MKFFENIYIILLALIMPFILKIQNEVYGMVSIGYGILAGIIYTNNLIKAQKKDPVIEKLEKQLDKTDDYLKTGKGLIAISEIFKKESNIPEIITIKSIIYPVKESIIDDVLPLARENKAPYDIDTIELLDSILSDFDYKTIKNAKEEMLALDERKNVFFLKEGVVSTVQIQGKEKQKLGGILILTLYGILFSPLKFELFKNIDKDKLWDLVHKVTESMPFINIGVATASLLNSYSSGDTNTKFFTEEKIGEVLHDFNTNNGWYLPYQKIDSIIYPTKMVGLKAVKPSITIVSDKNTYELFHADEKYDFKDELLDQLIFVNVLHRQVFFPHEHKAETSFEKCKFVHHSEIDYKNKVVAAN